MVIGTAAYCGSGQDTLADDICNIYGIEKYSIGDMVRKMAEEQGRPQDRRTLRSIRKECDRIYGRMYFPQMLIEEIKKKENKSCVITGIRTMEEYRLFKQTFEFYLIFLNAQENIRLQRMLKRNEDKDDDSIEKLREQMKEEYALFDYKELEAVADIYFDFSMSMSEYKIHAKEIIFDVMTRMWGKCYETKRKYI